MTFCLPITSKGESYIRPIRLILIERLEGTSLYDLWIQSSTRIHDGPDAFHLPEEYRLEVLAQAMDAWVRELHYGVNQGDFAARNVMVVSNDTTTATFPISTSRADISRVVLIDYNAAVVDSYTLQGTSAERSLTLPVNPMQWFWKQTITGEFYGWVPSDWEKS